MAEHVIEARRNEIRRRELDLKVLATFKNNEDERGTVDTHWVPLDVMLKQVPLGSLRNMFIDFLKQANDSFDEIVEKVFDDADDTDDEVGRSGASSAAGRRGEGTFP